MRFRKKEACNYLIEQGTCCICRSQPHSHEHLTLARGSGEVDNQDTTAI